MIIYILVLGANITVDLSLSRTICFCLCFSLQLLLNKSEIPYNKHTNAFCLTPVLSFYYLFDLMSNPPGFLNLCAASLYVCGVNERKWDSQKTQ